MIIRRLRDLPIRFKLFAVYSCVSIATFSLCFTLLFFQFQAHLEKNINDELSKSNLIISQMLPTATTMSIQNHLRTIAKKNLEIVEMLYSRYQKGEMTETEAADLASNILLSQKIGKTGYIYCIDTKGIVIVHPHDEIRGNSFADQEFIQYQIKHKKGYLEYDWVDPGDDTPRKKALYMVYFKQWDWIISVSSYAEEFGSLLNIEYFREEILNLAFGKDGYSFIVDIHGNIILHPELSGNLSSIKDRRADIIREIIKKKEGTLHSKINFKNNKCDEVLAVFNQIPKLNWIVASVTCKNNILWPLYETRRIFYLNLLLSLMITATVTLMVSSSLTKPLEHLIRRFEKGAGGDFTVQAIEDRNDEIGRLALSFNQFMSQLAQSRDELVEEIKVRKTTEIQLKLFEKVFENVNEGITITDIDGNIEAVNHAFTDITGYSPDEVIGQNPRVLKSDRHDEAFYKNMWDSIIIKGFWAGEIWNRRKNGEAYPELLSISAIGSEKDGDKKFVAVFHDISDMKLKEEQIEHMAYHDPLTGLPNRALLKDRLRKAILDAKRMGEMIQVLFIDLDNFKNVNDTIGHAKGDQLLKEAAERMLATIRASDTVSRLGGDEFVIISNHIKSTEEMLIIVERLQSAFQKPFLIDDHSFHITCSIGISMYPDDGENAETLIRNADLAMYQAKYTGKNVYSTFTREMAHKVKARVQLETEMRDAIGKGEFQVYFQPRVNIETFEPKGMEALVRWIKPDGTVIPPIKFIPIAEESGLILPLGQIIFKNAVEGAARVREKTGLDLSVSINVSARQFENQNFTSMVEEIISETGFPTHDIEIEITESLLLKDNSAVIQRMETLADMGIMTAIDDFGTGYSSLAYIKKLPISVLKIDKSFIDDLPHDSDDMVLVETIVLMANKLHLAIVAEGVETSSQLDALKKMGNMEVQGYLFSPPIPENKFIEWIESKAYKLIL